MIKDYHNDHYNDYNTVGVLTMVKFAIIRRYKNEEELKRINEMVKREFDDRIGV